MAVFAPTNTFQSGSSITAAGHNTNWTDLATWINARYNGTDTWSFMKVSSTNANPVDIASSAATTEVSIDNTATDGDPTLTFKLSGVTKYTLGVDDSDSDFFDFATTAIGTARAFRVPAAGQQVQFANGTVAAPSISFLNKPDFGFYYTGTPDILNVSLGNSRQFYFQSNAFNPVGGGTRSSGDGTDYWNDISYKTLTDRGCLGWFDEGVELQDGTVVSDTEALLAIQKDPEKTTIYGKPMLDYSTFPKVSYKKEEVGEDGIEMTSMFSIMIGAIKELTLRVKTLEGK